MLNETDTSLAAKFDQCAEQFPVLGPNVGIVAKISDDRFIFKGCWAEYTEHKAEEVNQWIVADRNSGGLHRFSRPV